MLRNALLAIIFFTLSCSSSANTLVQRFDNPQDNYKPWVFWYWINGNITKEGITADLTSMAEAGLGGVLLMHINEHDVVPRGPVVFGSDEYFALMEHTLSTATRLNLKVNLYNSEGWSVAGGPWITPALGMKELSWNEVAITDAQETVEFPPPHAPLGYYEDIATLAFPTPQSFQDTPFTSLVHTVNISGATSNRSAEALSVIDQDWNTYVEPTIDESSGETYVELAFSEPYTFSNAFIKFSVYGMMGQNALMVSDDGKSYRQIAMSKRGQIYDDVSCFQFPSETAKYVKIVFKPTDNKLLYTAMPKVRVSVREINLDNKPRLDDWCQKASHIFPFFMEAAERDSPKQSLDTLSDHIPLESIVDVSEYLAQDGTLHWSPPTDNWTVVRFGMSSTEAINRPGSPGGEGLEVDKLSSRALKVHFDNYLSKVLSIASNNNANALVSTHADSWEVGRQNWTQGFDEDFEQLRGYSPIPFLPATLGYGVGSTDTSEKFLWDMRKTISDLIVNRFYGGMRRHANSLGIDFSTQSMKPFIDNLHALGQADILYANSAFRSLSPEENRPNQEFAYLTAKMTSSAGSIYNKPVRSESFTSLPQANRWLSHPLTFKSQADTDFAGGATLVTHHLFTHQPWVDLKPGMTLGYWGLHFERTQTWWHEIDVWNRYLQRTQSMMDFGQPVFDVLHLLGDDASTKFDRDFVYEALPAGYDFEFISSHGLLNKLNAQTDGKIGYDNRREYRILSLASDVSMRPEILKKLIDLLDAGATLVGSPPKFSPSLTNGSLADTEVSQLAGYIWGGNYAGQVFKTLPEALEKLSLGPDLVVSDTDNRLVWRHIKAPDGDFYFVSNLEHQSTTASLDFRVSGKRPELWDPLTGTRTKITNYTEENGRTQIRLTFDQAQSFFVVFPEQTTTDTWLNTGDFEPLQTLETQWRVDFVKGVQKPQAITMHPLIDLTQHSQENIRYFSGTIKYTTEFIFDDSNTAVMPIEYQLDLGEAHQFARVYLNGQDLGLRMWAPYHFDISHQLKPGKNRLSIEVTNLWPNRLIGDERQYPDTAEWKQNGYQGFQLSAFPEWLKGPAPIQPGERSTFATWKHWSKEDQLLPSGLIGPVKILHRYVKDR
ncbi:glycosyl hydrolase [Alteromonas sp. KUL49]|uniref:glycosyl hydrolase n=1 Tax=Alteromonas sp. KUL49 TaxID=2480798 RepID=UPI00102F2A4F|nr:glycosyl hydrolase [Alteromonas sp. KUL49]TAP39189.1 glycoside hydrolase [Alteromonas sp. KUL49]GEA11962.1 DNA-binding protein [Alteromonas sp. KUL49]